MPRDTETPTRPVAIRSDRRLLRNDVFELLLERILDGSLEPGARLKDSDLTSWLQVSRTPVREAIARLSAVGLVETAPNRFTIVAPLSPVDVVDAIAVLRRLYPDAVRQSLPALDADADLEVGLLAGRLERDDDQNAVEVFLRVMHVVLASLRNAVLAETVVAVHLRVLRHLRLEPGAASVLPRQRVLAFAAALRAHDPRSVRMVEQVLDDADVAVGSRALSLR
ncbi:GntR family transcriptional regulator [Leifsonia sp. LS1]|uniref:GntR family transcriptional regulator n=1 Tax=Leifsonia sp. LS1 TaxID=2828483 RepID=UPI001CFF3E14|nr:GntR family transcriptional regulator [Leifsonia sp. LS1]GIT78372.1 GntR family transcriptional regulator [Leifsonia sp. LS1]